MGVKKYLYLNVVKKKLYILYLVLLLLVAKILKIKSTKGGFYL